MRVRCDDPADRAHGRRPASDAGWRPWFAGAVAGSAMTTIGHPFDTTKVRMQASATQYHSTLQCIRQTVSKEGVLALYKGLTPAIVTTCLTSGLRFGVQHEFNARLVQYVSARRDGTGTSLQRFDSLPASARILAEGGGGAACGMVLPLIYTPMELIKCKRQVMADNTATNFQIARTVLREHGLFGLYTGHGLTVCRSTIGNATLFGSYEMWRSLLLAVLGVEKHDSSTLVNTAAGVLSGWTTTLCCFPIDSLKSRTQVALGTEQQSTQGTGPLGILRGLAELWREGKCYRGVSAMLLRAIPVHAVYMPTYSLTLAFVSRSHQPRRGHEQQPDSLRTDRGNDHSLLLRRRSSTHSDY